MRASTPGKVMLAGEYAVLTGRRAIVAAITRRVSAKLGEQESSRSPFLRATVTEIAARFGANSPQAHAAGQVVVDSNSLRQAGKKLGLGSSAAVTVAAVTLALGNDVGEEDRRRIHAVAHAAHARAQTTLGAAGSGADVAACCFGGIVDVCSAPDGDPPLSVTRLGWPDPMRLVLVWTQQPASTAKLVAAVNAFARDSPGQHRACMDVLGNAADTLAQALGHADSSGVIAAFKQGADALAGLQMATNLALVPKAHGHVAALAQRFGGAAKPTGAGGGDLLAAVFADSAAAEGFCAEASQQGIVWLEAAVDPTGTMLGPRDGP